MTQKAIVRNAYRSLLALAIVSLACSCETTATILTTIKQESAVAYRNLLLANYESKKDRKNWDNLSSLDTAANSEFLTYDERNIILELNKVRSNPSKYADLYIRPLLATFQGSIRMAGGNRVQTNEGTKAVDECLRVLKSASPVQLLVADAHLSELARQHVLKQGPTGKTGHGSPDGRSFAQRIADSQVTLASVGENIAYGESGSRDIVVQLLVDDGVPTRGHRKNILLRDYNCCGVSEGRHAVYTSMAVVDFGRK